MCQKTIITVEKIEGEYVDPALTLTAKTGFCVLTAMVNITDMDVKLDAFMFSMLQKSWQGNIYGGCDTHMDIPNLLNL